MAYNLKKYLKFTQNLSNSAQGVALLNSKIKIAFDTLFSWILGQQKFKVQSFF